MMKKVMALLMAALLMLALAGCGENKNNTNRPGSNSNNTTNGSNDADKGNGTVNDGLTDSNGAARNGRSSYGTYRDRAMTTPSTTTTAAPSAVWARN